MKNHELRNNSWNFHEFVPNNKFNMQIQSTTSQNCNSTFLKTNSNLYQTHTFTNPYYSQTINEQQTSRQYNSTNATIHTYNTQATSPEESSLGNNVGSNSEK